MASIVFGDKMSRTDDIGDLLKPGTIVRRCPFIPHYCMIPGTTEGNV